ncbi:MAG: hypothetical protein R3C52_06260 [Hyphomonadaceae bacterium]
MRPQTFGFLVMSALVIVVVAIGMFALPAWNVWRAKQQGLAELARAENERKILIEQARAEAEAAKYLRAAEVERAHGVAEANAIIAEGLGGPEGYLRYLWINKLGTNGQDVIYVPTEAGIPILEAGRGVEHAPLRSQSGK